VERRIRSYFQKAFPRKDLGEQAESFPEGRPLTVPDDDRAVIVKAYSRATRGITIAMVMTVPGIVGHFVDERFGTLVVFTVLGSVIGLTFGIWQLMKISRPSATAKSGGPEPEARINEPD
jgi:multidrug efflux pump subunit AcrB